MKKNQNISNKNQRTRVCLTLDLKNEPELIEQYKYWHSKEHHWQEINDGIKQAGVLVMDIYLVDNRMFMICEIDENADFDQVWQQIGTYPRQNEWGEFMNQFIQAVPGHKLEWVKTEKVFELR